MNLVHNLLPDLSGIGFSVNARHSPRGIVSHPDCGGVVAGVAAEPGVFAAVGGTGFSGCRHIIFQSQAVAGSVGFREGSL